VALDSTWMLIDGQEQAIAPGVAVTAEIKDGPAERDQLSAVVMLPLLRWYAYEEIRER
jgi:hypothetical protein